MKNRILVVGSVAIDSVSTVCGKVEKALGGSAVYSSIAASLFSPVRLVGVAGTDFPEKYVRLLKNKKVDVSGLEIVPGKTFFWKGSYDKDFRNAVSHDTQLNVFETFNPKVSAGNANCEVLFLANIHPVIQLDVLGQMKNPLITACDTMNYWISREKKHLLRLLKKIDVLFVNEEEARQLSGQHNLIKAAKLIRAMGPEVLVIKKGDNGAMLFTGSGIFSMPAYPVVKVADPTGAGDTFAGGFMGFLASCGSGWRRTDSLKKAMAHGTVMSSFNVEKFSVSGTCGLKASDVRKRYAGYVGSLRIC